jgi:4-amino-4-deoxy-L-arabinose transferase-like glycosyltransferase
MGPVEVRERPEGEAFGTRVTSMWLWSVVALGAVLRLLELGRKSFWLDEIASVWTARLPSQNFWPFLWRSEGNMALYYVLLRSWLHVGTGEASVRVLSAIIGIVSIPVMYALANRLFGGNTARLAALFFALNACAIVVSQEARSYSLLVLGVVASTYLFVRLIEGPTFGLACAYGAVAGLTLYCHYFGMLVPAAQAVSLMALPPEKRPWKQWALGACIVVLAAIPVLWMIHIQDIGHLAWVQKPSWLELYHFGIYLAAGGGKAVGAILLLLDLALLALFLRRLTVLWRDRDRDLRCWRYAMVASCLFTPAVLALLVSIARPIFYHRFLIISLPAWVLTTALGAEEIRSRGWRWACIACVCGLSLVSAIASYPRVQEDWRGVTGYLMEQARPEDRVLYYQGVGYFAAEHYRDWLPGGSALRPQGVRVEAVDSDWQKEIDGATRVWLVLYRAKRDDAGSRAIDASLRNRYQVVQEVPFQAVTVVEYRAEK